MAQVAPASRIVRVAAERVRHGLRQPAEGPRLAPETGELGGRRIVPRLIETVGGDGAVIAAFEDGKAVALKAPGGGWGWCGSGHRIGNLIPYTQ